MTLIAYHAATNVRRKGYWEGRTEDAQDIRDWLASKGFVIAKEVTL